jgi:uncharacterized protein (DUF1501 family)
MKRRSFLKNISLAAGSHFLINGVAVQAIQANNKLIKFARMSKNDKVLVILQLHGGNDGLNAVIPINQYNYYYNLRPNLAISESGARKYIRLDNTLPDKQAIGLHPDLTGMKSLYDSGRMAIIQNVGYEYMNGSHFKGRDIWFGGGGYNDPITSGWIGRYLEMEFTANGEKFPDDFPYNSEMKDPLALEFSGGDVSLGFQTETTIPTAVAISDPEGFFGLVSSLDGYKDKEGVDPRGIPPTTIFDPTKPAGTNSLYGEELNWILGIEKGTDKYAERLRDVYRKGDATNSGVTYPVQYPYANSKNPISGALEIVSKLIAGGCQTKVYMIRMGGFDTHVQQVESYDNSLGKHAAMIYHISSAMKAFQDDLKARNIDNKVLTVTMSEFGRRAEANNSYGSDHGTVAPMFVFGSQVNPGVIGDNTDLKDLTTRNGGNLIDYNDRTNNIVHVIDYRIVFNTILQKWFDVEVQKIPTVFPTLKQSVTNGLIDSDVYDIIPLLRNGSITALDNFMNRRFRLNDVYPNPVAQTANFNFYIDNPAHVEFGLYDMKGRLVKWIVNERKGYGEHTVMADLSNIPAGNYIYKIDAGYLKDARRLVKI